MVTVAIAQNKSSSIAVHEAIHHLGGIESFVKAEDKVVIKPNLVFGIRPFTGFTTDPPVVQAIVRLCKSMSPSEIIIAEGSGGIGTHQAYRMSGYVELAELHGLKLVDLNESPTKRVEVPEGKIVRELDVPNVILDCDVLINVPKLKLYKRISERKDWMSVAVKNLLGALPGKGEYSPLSTSGMSVELSREFWVAEGRFYHPSYRQWWSPRGEKQRIHKNLAQGLVDVNTVIKPTLNVVDGMTVSNDVNITHASGETPLELNTVLASSDPVALDFISALIAGFDPLEISYLRAAAERSIGESDYNMIQVLGTPLEDVTKSWKMRYE